jgi:2,3-bisphosphoglycerate-dependent phosphoglycerate mutase
MPNEQELFMAILLVRHAESVANINKILHRTMGDHAIPLTEKGEGQADQVGEFLDNYLSFNLPGEKVRLWASPYKRTTQTAQGIYNHAPHVPWDVSVRGNHICFDPRLRERESGYFDGLDDEEIEKEYPDQWRHYQKTKQDSGNYYTRPYGGESAADVCDRLSTFKETLWRDIHSGVKHHVIVNHGFTLRCFVTSFLNLHPDSFAEEKNPSNTAVRLLDIDPITKRYADYGYIYDPKEGLYLNDRPPEPRPFYLAVA